MRYRLINPLIRASNPILLTKTTKSFIYRRSYTMAMHGHSEVSIEGQRVCFCAGCRSNKYIRLAARFHLRRRTIKRRGSTSPSMGWRFVRTQSVATCGSSPDSRNETDKTGPSSATSAIIIMYDIFGFSPQTLQVRATAIAVSFVISLIALPGSRYPRPCR